MVPQNVMLKEIEWLPLLLKRRFSYVCFGGSHFGDAAYLTLMHKTRVVLRCVCVLHVAPIQTWRTPWHMAEQRQAIEIGRRKTVTSKTFAGIGVSMDIHFKNENLY